MASDWTRAVLGTRSRLLTVVGTIIVLVVVLGIFPGLVLGYTEAPVAAILERMAEHVAR